jgi:hypothetical protein
MLKIVLRSKWVFLAAVSISACAMSGCIEATFNLASESRLPQGVTIPPGLTRADVSVTLDEIGPSESKFTVRDKKGKKLTTLKGKEKESSIYVEAPPQRRHDASNPAYGLVTINGVTEVIMYRPYREHENMVQDGKIVALFYVIDDPAIRQKLLTSK